MLNYHIDKQIVSDLKNWFINYVNTFRYNDAGMQQTIDLKKYHTERVAEEIINIGRQSGLDESQLNLAEIIALFHDLGRFEQYARYQTFSDRRSEDHAELGIKILKENNILDLFPDEIQELIICSIKYHNKLSLPVIEKETCLFYCRLIRDADKLDIFRIVTEFYNKKNPRNNNSLVLELPDTPGFSNLIYQTLLNKQLVDMKHVRNINDLKFLQAGLIFDINYKPSFRCIKERGYIESLRQTFPPEKKVADVFNIITSFLEERI